MPPITKFIGLIPVGCALAYVLWVAIHIRRIIAAIHLNPDASWAPVLARDLAMDRRGGHILVGAASHFTTIWFLVLTRWLPFRNTIWDAAPVLAYLLGLGIVAWACYRVAGWWPAVLTVAIGVSATSVVLLAVMAEGIHGATYVATGVVAAFLVFWVRRSDGAMWPGRIAVAGVVVMAGVTLASDSLFLPSGLGPLLGAPVALFLVKRDRRSARFALWATGIVVASAVVAVAANAWMARLGFRRTYNSGGYALASPHIVRSNVRVFGQRLLVLGNGTSATTTLRSTDGVHVVMAIFLAGAVTVPFLLLVGCIRSVRQWSGGIDDARFVYLAYWVLSGLAVFAAFSLSAFAQGPSDPSRYVAPVFFALTATVPIGAARVDWRRVTVAAGVTLFCVLSIGGRQGLFLYESLLGRTAPARTDVIAFLESQGVSHGYTGYFDSHPMTLQSDLHVHFYPVISCHTPVTPRLCPFFVNTRTNWYLPRAATRTFVLYDASDAPSLAAVPTLDLGVPTVSRRFGQMYLYIYDYDVASRLALPCPAGSANQFFCPNAPS